MRYEHRLLIRQFDHARMTAGEADRLLLERFGHTSVERLLPGQAILLARELATETAALAAQQHQYRGMQRRQRRYEAASQGK